MRIPSNIKQFQFGEIPDDQFVMTTWHEKEPIQEVFWYAEHCAVHGSLELKQTYIVHIALQDRATELLDTFRGSQNNLPMD